MYMIYIYIYICTHVDRSIVVCVCSHARVSHSLARSFCLSLYVCAYVYIYAYIRSICLLFHYQPSVRSCYFCNSKTSTETLVPVCGVPRRPAQRSMQRFRGVSLDLEARRAATQQVKSPRSQNSIRLREMMSFHYKHHSGLSLHEMG